VGSLIVCGKTSQASRHRGWTARAAVIACRL